MSEARNGCPCADGCELNHRYMPMQFSLIGFIRRVILFSIRKRLVESIPVEVQRERLLIDPVTQQCRVSDRKSLPARKHTVISPHKLERPSLSETTFNTKVC